MKSGTIFLPVVSLLSLSFIIGAYFAYAPSFFPTSDLPTITQSSTLTAFIEGNTCISTDGYFEGRKTPAHQGIVEELPDCGDHNLLYMEGMNLTRDALARGLVVNATTISICNTTFAGNGPGNCSSPVTAQTELWDNFTGCGLTKTNGTIAYPGPNGNWTVTATFTNSCVGSQTTNVTRLELVNSSNDVLAANTFTVVNLSQNDQVTINWSLSIRS